MCPRTAGLLPNGIGWGKAERWTRLASELRGSRKAQAVVPPLEPLGSAGPEANASVKLVSYGKQGRFLELVFLKALIADGARGL